LAVNPDIVRQQMEGAIIFGLTAALNGEINIENGRIKQSNFHDYRMLTLADAPDIEVHIIESGDTPSGIGEPGTPVIAPAVANAVFAATGKRLRALPLRL
jgi:isoquinoline 1-oxidoreductase beta subunit